MFILTCTMDALAIKEEFWNDGAMAINMLKENVKSCIEAGYFRKGLDLDETSLLLWSQVHSIVSLYNTERLNIYAIENKKEFMFRAFDVFFSLVQRGLS